MHPKRERARGTLSLRIETSIQKELKRLAKADHRTVASYVRKVLRNHVEQGEQIQ